MDEDHKARAVLIALAHAVGPMVPRGAQNAPDRGRHGSREWQEGDHTDEMAVDVLRVAPREANVAALPRVELE